jgi:hypothetical protein
MYFRNLGKVFFSHMYIFQNNFKPIKRILRLFFNLFFSKGVEWLLLFHMYLSQILVHLHILKRNWNLKINISRQYISRIEVYFGLNVYLFCH